MSHRPPLAEPGLKRKRADCYDDPELGRCGEGVRARLHDGEESEEREHGVVFDPNEAADALLQSAPVGAHERALMELAVFGEGGEEPTSEQAAARLAYLCAFAKSALGADLFDTLPDELVHQVLLWLAHDSD